MSTNAVTFVATSNNVKATKISSVYCHKGCDLRKIIVESKAFDDDYEKLVQSSTIQNGQSQLIEYARWGFVSSVVDAYNMHHNLVIRPDDIWQAILTQFSFYVNKNAEALRNKFVDFDGKKELVIAMGGSLFTADFGVFAKRMVDEQICKNIKDPEVTKWLLPNFSTTTDTDRIVASVTIMSTLQEYFDYLCCIMCGIPNVTLLGSVDDWYLLRQKIDRLLQYDIEGEVSVMKKWHEMLSKVMDEFIRSVEGRPSLKFWDTVAHRSGGGSGPSYLSGWVTVFSCFDVNGYWQGNLTGENYWPKIETDKIPVAAVSVPVKIDDNGVEYDAKMTCGQIVYTVTGENSDTIQPRSDWCIAIKSKEKNGE